MSDIKIRPLKVTDFDSYARLRLLGLETDPSAFWASKEETIVPGFKQRFESLVSHEFNFCLGAFEDEQLLGIMTFFRYSQYKVSFKGDIVGVYVDPAARGRKIADGLLKAVIAKAFSQNGLTKIMLAVTANNNAAFRLYEKHGFVQYGYEKLGMRVGDTYYDQYFMELNKESYQ
jgi:RimJ/RimL family protein N-acetyltransferase